MCKDIVFFLILCKLDSFIWFVFSSRGIIKMVKYMIKIWKTENKKLQQKQTYEKNVWLCLVCPTNIELQQVCDDTKISFHLLKKVLDKNESARIEVRDGSTLIVLSMPVKGEHSFKTVPVGIILSNNGIVTLVNHENLGNTIFPSFIEKYNPNTDDKIAFLLNLLLEITAHYQGLLNEIEKLLETKERNLLKASSNEEMKELLKIDKSLVYFIKALNMNEVVFEKLAQKNSLKDSELLLLEDVVIENKQSINMATLYQDLLRRVMDSYETIISNNLNQAMKFLTGITIVFTIPTMVSSFMGMNVKLGYFNDSSFAFPVIVTISFLLSIFVAYIFKRKNWL